MAGRRLTAVFNAAGTPGFIPDLDYERLKALVILRTGHHYYQDKDDLLWERLRRRWRSLGLPGAADYLALLADPQRGEAEWSALEAEITIGETFFFRYAEQFVALRDHILPNLIARSHATRRLRLWSAGCANGAEPYSLGILLREKLGDALPDWRIHLIGTDINEAVLETARRAEFGHWALRTLTAEELARDFTPTPDGRSWALRPQHRTLVRFTRHNLLSLLDGTSPLQFNEFDLILCRNVLIYFHPDMVQRIVRALCERLTAGGWLLLGHAEPHPAFQDFMEVVSLPGTVAYRRPMEPRPPPVLPAPWQPGLPPPSTSLWPLPPPQPVVAPRPVLARHPQPQPSLAQPPPHGVRLAVRDLANRGDLAGARQACQQGLQANPVDAGLHFYAAIVARALGETAAAEQAFRRALYLDGAFVMAHYQLGLLLLDQGQREAGRRALANALRIAQHLPDRSALEEGDGMTAKELRDSVRLQLETIAAPPVRS
jgi:chemotaxis protein methyltransferase CheR